MVWGWLNMVFHITKVSEKARKTLTLPQALVLLGAIFALGVIACTSCAFAGCIEISAIVGGILALAGYAIGKK